MGLGEGIMDGAGVGSRVVGNRVGLGVGKTEGLPVGEGVGMAVGSHVLHVSDKDVARPPVVSPMSYVVQVAVAKGGVFILIWINGLIDRNNIRSLNRPT